MVTVYLATERASRSKSSHRRCITIALWLPPRSNLRAVGNASSCTATFCNSDSTYPLLSIIAPCASRDHQCFLQQANGKWALLKRILVSRSFNHLPPFLRPSLHLYPSPVRSRSPNYPTPLRNRYSSLLVKTCLPNNRFYRFYADSAKRSFLFFLFSLSKKKQRALFITSSPKFRVRDSKRRAMFQHRLHRRSTLRHPRLNFNW